MIIYSKVYKNIKGEVIEETRQLVKNGFWKSEMSVEDKMKICVKWLQAASQIYGVEIPSLKFNPSAARYNRTGGGIYTPHLKEITIYKKFSLVTLLHEFRHHMQYEIEDLKLYKGDLEHDARAWSVSLYKLALPESYKRACENGILHFK